MAKKLTMKVYPHGWGREVYRVFEFSDQQNLDSLCMFILDLFDFDYDHLYAFYMDNKMRGSQDSYTFYGHGGRSETSIKLARLDLQKGAKFILHYDFGDDWIFHIGVQKVEDVEGKIMNTLIKAKGEIEQYPSWDDE